MCLGSSDQNSVPKAKTGSLLTLSMFLYYVIPSIMNRLFIKIM